MVISRYAMSGFVIAVLSIAGLTQARISVGSGNPPAPSGAYTPSTNGLHAQLMREASSAYVSRPNGAGRAEDLAPRLAAYHDASQH